MSERAAVVELHSDGWTLFVGSRTYSWDHNDPSLGTAPIVRLLEDLGFSVTFSEVC